MDSIKFPNSHHARVNLVVQLQSKYGDQHGAYCMSLIRQEPRRDKQTNNRRQIIISVSDSDLRLAREAHKSRMPYIQPSEYVILLH